MPIAVKVFYFLIALLQLITLIFADLLEYLPNGFRLFGRFTTLRWYPYFTYNSINNCKISNMARYIADSSESYIILYFTMIRCFVVRFPFKARYLSNKVIIIGMILISVVLVTEIR